MEAEMPPGPSLVESFKMAFDDSETADVKFLVEGREISAHKALLKIRCQHFRSMFQDCWEENERAVVEINQFSYPVYKVQMYELVMGWVRKKVKFGLVVKGWDSQAPPCNP